MGDWQPFASAMAASVVHNMFKYSDVIERWPHYQKSAPATTTAGTEHRKTLIGDGKLIFGEGGGGANIHKFMLCLINTNI